MNKNPNVLVVFWGVFFKVPYEILNKKFRSGQKNIDREVSHVQQASSEVEQCMQDQKAPSVQHVSLVLDNMVEKLCFLKRKV